MPFFGLERRNTKLDRVLRTARRSPMGKGFLQESHGGDDTGQETGLDARAAGGLGLVGALGARVAGGGAAGGGGGRAGLVVAAAALDLLADLGGGDLNGWWGELIREIPKGREKVIERERTYCRGPRACTAW